MANAKLDNFARPNALRAAALLACVLLAAAGCGQKDGGSGATVVREFAVEGMTCEACVNTLTAALKKVPGVEEVKVSLEEKKATVTADEKAAPIATIEAAITEAGYKGQLIPPPGA